MFSKVRQFIPSIVTALIGLIIVLLIPYQIDLSKVRTDTAGINSQTIPYFLSYSIIMFSLLDILLKIVKKNKESQDSDPVSPMAYIRVFITFIGILVWILAVPYLGFVIAMSLLLIMIMLLMGNRKWYFVTAIPICTSLLLKYVFTEFVGRTLPSGLFF